MDPALATEVAELTSYGWDVKTQTETTAFLETRRPFNWWILALSILLLLGFGALLYLLFWLIFARAQLFLRVEGGEVKPSGDIRLLEEHRRHADDQRRLAEEIKQKGFLKVMWPSILATVATIAIWLVIIWWFLNWIR